MVLLLITIIVYNSKINYLHYALRNEVCKRVFINEDILKKKWLYYLSLTIL